MKNTVIISLFFAIITAAVLGCLTIFDVLSTERALDLLLKFEAAIVLLGGCTILIGYLFKAKSGD
ncbi:MAG: hypothetical protein OEY74_07870 [Gammaproteobacteria bacterium]|nr:hypothetical protein [Gammaproteobacteria bacterium]